MDPQVARTRVWGAVFDGFARAGDDDAHRRSDSFVCFARAKRKENDDDDDDDDDDAVGLVLFRARKRAGTTSG